MFKKILFTVLIVSLGTFIISHLSYGQSTTSTTTQSKGQVTTEVSTTTPATPRPSYDQEALKKMNDTLCVEGFDAKVGNDNKNICSGQATTPDIAYSCIWKKKGEAAYPATRQGPCRLDNSEHRGNIMITKADYKSSPPLDYGTKVECCLRAAIGPSTTSTTSSTTSSSKK